MPTPLQESGVQDLFVEGSRSLCWRSKSMNMQRFLLECLKNLSQRTPLPLQKCDMQELLVESFMKPSGWRTLLV